ncbi:hypothetical protein ABPG74_014868 [Tetrahymena malaccensis]
MYIQVIQIQIFQNQQLQKVNNSENFIEIQMLMGKRYQPLKIDKLNQIKILFKQQIYINKKFIGYQTNNQSIFLDKVRLITNTQNIIKYLRVEQKFNLLQEKINQLKIDNQDDDEIILQQ